MNLINRPGLYDFDSLLGDFFPTHRHAVESQSGLQLPKVDIEDHDNSYLLKAELPGVKKEDLSVEIHDGLLTIQTQASSESEEKKEGKVIRRERSSSSYSRSFNVGKGITENDINGSFENGLLTLTIPKVDESAGQKKRIEIS